MFVNTDTVDFDIRSNDSSSFDNRICPTTMIGRGWCRSLSGEENLPFSSQQTMQMKDKLGPFFHGGNDGDGSGGGGGGGGNSNVSMRDSCVCVLDCCFLFGVDVCVEGHVGGDGAWFVFGMKNLCIFSDCKRDLCLENNPRGIYIIRSSVCLF